MARARRRSGRLNAAATPEPTVEVQESQSTPTAPINGEYSRHQEEDKCPACEENREQGGKPDQENWVRCDACKVWFHWRCAGEGDLETIDKWYCPPCLKEDSKRVITLKPPARKSSRKRAQRDYAGLHSGLESDPNRWLRMMQGKPISPDPFRRMKGSELSMEWLEHDNFAMSEPVVIESVEGLGMKMPLKTFTVDDVADIVGEDAPVEVIDVATQSNLPGWTLGKWAEYYDTEPAARDKIRNVISLEISGTELADKILPPRLVREVDWVEKFWPSTKKGRGHSYPKVQLYCLMGVADAWTDWHIDFAGSSVYYHILHGAKVFYFIRPTPSNLAAYEKWSGTEMQNHSWLGDMVDEVFKVELSEGNTMIIPTGWIHAVYTPIDTLVFGGNFLHSYNVATQLKVREIEIATHVPKKFRFPFFVRLCWYAGEKYLRDLKAKEEFPSRVLDSVEALAEFLVSEARTMERGTEQAKKEAKEQVPNDRVKDAAAVARELRWRVRAANGYSSEDDARSRRKTKVTAGESFDGIGVKRRRIGQEEGSDDGALLLFRNFRPKSWDISITKPTQREMRTKKLRKIAFDDEKWAETWSKELEDPEDIEGGESVTVERSRSTIIKIRRTGKGFERQRTERTVEDWVWSGEEDRSPSATNGGPEPPEVKMETEESAEARTTDSCAEGMEA